MKAVRRHSGSARLALPECLEETAQPALRALERVLPCANRLVRTRGVQWNTRHSAYCAGGVAATWRQPRQPHRTRTWSSMAHRSSSTRGRLAGWSPVCAPVADTLRRRAPHVFPRSAASTSSDDPKHSGAPIRVSLHAAAAPGPGNRVLACSYRGWRASGASGAPSPRAGGGGPKHSAAGSGCGVYWLPRGA